MDRSSPRPPSTPCAPPPGWPSTRPTDPVRARDLSRRQRHPGHYLSKILRRLVLAGILESQKGHGGGFTLARPPVRDPLRGGARGGRRLPRLRSLRLRVGRVRSRSDPCPLHESWSRSRGSFREWAATTTLAERGRSDRTRAAPARAIAESGASRALRRRLRPRAPTAPSSRSISTGTPRGTCKRAGAEDAVAQMAVVADEVQRLVRRGDDLHVPAPARELDTAPRRGRGSPRPGPPRPTAARATRNDPVVVADAHASSPSRDAARARVLDRHPQRRARRAAGAAASAARARSRGCSSACGHPVSRIG